MSWKLVKHSLIVLREKPIFILPIFLSWVVIIFFIIYIQHYLVFPKSIGMGLLVIYLCVFFITLVIGYANILMIELVEFVEKGKPIEFFKAMTDAVLNLIKAVPILAIWALIWAMILIIKALAAAGKKKNKKYRSSSGMNLRMAAELLTQSNSSFSWLRLGLWKFERIMRMFVFLSLPGICWEGRGPFGSLKRSKEIIKEHPTLFLDAYSLSIIVFLVISIPVYIATQVAHFPDNSIFWFFVILYVCCIWTLGIYLEQMMLCLIYLWHIKWEKKGKPQFLPKKPSLLDSIYELKDLDD